jgi:hypothetical protein
LERVSPLQPGAPPGRFAKRRTGPGPPAGAVEGVSRTESWGNEGLLEDEEDEDEATPENGEGRKLPEEEEDEDEAASDEALRDDDIGN